MKRELVNAPLSEVIFEVKWNVSELARQSPRDSKIIAGIFSEKLKNIYPYYQKLEAADFPGPDEIFSGVVQHRFRVAQNRWPLVQVGPGVLSVNDLHDVIPYVWPDFKQRCIAAFQELEGIQPFSPYIESVSLRYVNAVEFDFENNDPINFLEEKMKLKVDFHKSILAEAHLNSQVKNFNFRFSFTSDDLPGHLNVVFGSGARNGVNALVWDLTFVSGKDSLAGIESTLPMWLETSHEKIEKVFFSLIENAHEIS